MILPPADKWPIVLYRKSILKQRKFKEIAALLGPTQGLHCLDVGGDNGVVSYLLRQSGGNWKSADLDERAVRAIRELVRDDVYQIDGLKTCFRDNEFDRVVIVDFLEHIRTDSEFASELYRILKPGGELIVNVPHMQNGMLRRLRLALGETDEKHGHVRPGYTAESLSRVLESGFAIVARRTYSKFFSEMLDTFLNFAYSRVETNAASAKGTIVTGTDLRQHHKVFRLYSVAYPLFWLIAKLDGLLFWTSGYMLLAKAVANKEPRGLQE